MKKNEYPDPNKVYPIAGIDSVTYIKPTIKNKNIIVGEFTYFSGDDFERHVIHHYDFYGDKLIIGKFCQIGAGVKFIMNGANHQMNAVSTFPFYVLEGWKQEVPKMTDMPMKGNTVIGNDVWIGENVTILPGIKIGDGAIVGANSTVSKDILPYSIVGGNPANIIRKRFDNELIDILLKVKWWNKEIDEINSLIPILTDSNLGRVKEILKNKYKI